MGIQPLAHGKLGGDRRQRVLDGLGRLPSYRTALGEERASAYR